MNRLFLLIPLVPFPITYKKGPLMHIRDRIWWLCLKALKRWTRAGLLAEASKQINILENPTVLSVGGYGPVDNYLKALLNNSGGRLITFDINPMHAPQIVGDVTQISVILEEQRILPDIIIALEVLEHVPHFDRAILSCYQALSASGVFLMSTPWITPIHDRPGDYFRFTPELMKLHLAKFGEFKILARGNYSDSLIALMLRGLFTGGISGKLAMVVGIFLSAVSPLPRVYDDIENVDSCLGYISVAKKLH